MVSLLAVYTCVICGWFKSDGGSGHLDVARDALVTARLELRAIGAHGTPRNQTIPLERIYDQDLLVPVRAASHVPCWLRLHVGHHVKSATILIDNTSCREPTQTFRDGNRYGRMHIPQMTSH